MMDKKDIKAGMLVFQSPLKKTDFEAAIQNVFSDSDITHVGLAIGEGSIIEALREKGVVETKIDDFFMQGHSHFIYEFDDELRIQKACDFAKKQRGKPYNPLFLPDGEGFYCSQLIVAAYNQISPPLFFEDKLNFREENSSEISEYWQKYYDFYGVDIPQGKAGSHPARLMRQIDKCYFKGVI